MAFCAFADGNAMFGSTPVENMFILEYMPAAPGDFVRVYLYGLMLCHHPEIDEGLEAVAKALRIEPEAVISAYRYWEREGLVVRLSDNPPTYSYVPLSRMTGASEPMDEVYRYRNFNQELQQALPGMVLESHEIRIANDWLDVMHLKEDVILLMVRAEVKRRGEKLPAPRTLFKRLNETAQEWAKAGISSIAEAEEYLKRASDAAKCAQSVVRQFGLNRQPTKDEIDLAEKWTRQWGLSREEVVAACADTVKSSNPSFAYLDRILESRRTGGADEGDRACVKRLLAHLGVSSRPTPAQLESYKSFRSWGFEFAAIEQAAIWCGENNRRTFDDIGRKLEQWRKIGAFTLPEIEEERRVQKQFTDICLNVFERCGIDKRVTKTDIGQVRIWTALVDLDTVLFAAECARGADAPMKYINKLVSSWSAQGIRTLDQAQKASQQHMASFASGATKPGQDYAQRDVTEEEFENGFYVDLMNRGKAEKP